ncbi:MAG: glycosyl hydrolase [bacterium]|nr:glycosyl hydrolase [bacterium]
MKLAWRAARVLLFAAWLLVLWWGIRQGALAVRQILANLPAGVTPVLALDELRKPGAGAVLGVFVPGVPEDMRLLDSLEETVRRRFMMVSFYQSWGSRPDQQFDPRALNRILAHGAIPVLTWEPWVTDFTRPGLPPMPDRQFRNLRAISSGQYDFYIERWARAARDWGHPLMVRLGHEMNASWYPWGERAFGNTAEDYIAMWRHVVGVFRRAGARNVLWVWSAALVPLGETYPGGDYVDWVGITVLNFGTVPPGWKWRSFQDLFSSHYDELKKTGKPIMVAEVASAEEGGDKADWIRDSMASLLESFPQVKAFMWFNSAQDRYWPINWSLTSSREAASAFRRAAADPYFKAPPR